MLAANTDSETHASSRERACVRRALVAANFTRAQHASRGMARAVVLPGAPPHGSTCSIPKAADAG